VEVEMNRLRLTRRVKDMTQEQLMKRTGIDFAVISRIERGSVQPTETQKMRLSDALGVAKDWLFPERKER
jgi:transcriptional regulator with XRE-family HTH domain